MEVRGFNNPCSHHKNGETSKSRLFVGEGNFSYSVSFIKKQLTKSDKKVFWYSEKNLGCVNAHHVLILW